jgi:hypothetical protein
MPNGKKRHRLFLDGVCFICKNKKEKEDLRKELKKRKEMIANFYLNKMIIENR